MATSKSYQLQGQLSRGLNCGKPRSYGYFFAKFFYLIFYFPLRIIFRHFFSLEVEGKENLKDLNNPLIIASSHASWIDPFLIGTIFDFPNKVFPIHYATWWKYYYFPVFVPLSWAFGCFPVRPKIGLEKSLLVPERILKSGGVVGIFPTGKRTRKWNENNPPRAKRGAAYLSLKANVPILPIKIEGNIGMKFKFFLKKKYKIKIKVGKVFYLPPCDYANPENLNEPSNYIMYKITQL